MKTDQTLMDLVNDCSPAPKLMLKEEAAESATRLASLGFTKLARLAHAKIRKSDIRDQGYPVITDEKIEKFLLNKAEAYNKIHLRIGGFIESIQQSGMGQLLSSASMNRLYGDLGVPTPRIQHPGIPTPTTFTDYDEMNSAQTFVVATCDMSSREPGTIGMYRWAETKIENYLACPPLDVLESLKAEKAKNLFDYFTIASVNEIHDPLLLGRIYNDNDRYFIRQWGEDISLDDLI